MLLGYPRYFRLSPTRSPGPSPSSLRSGDQSLSSVFSQSPSLSSSKTQALDPQHAPRVPLKKRVCRRRVLNDNYGYLLVQSAVISATPPSAMSHSPSVLPCLPWTSRQRNRIRDSLRYNPIFALLRSSPIQTSNTSPSPPHAVQYPTFPVGWNPGEG